MQQSDQILVSGKEGLHGTIMKSARADESQMLVQLDNGRQVVVPTSVLVRQDDGSYYLPFSLRELEQQVAQKGSSEAATLVLPVIAEQLIVQKREVATGGVRLRKVIKEHEETVDEPLLREEVKVERVAINRVVEGTVPVRQEGETMIIPVMEEVLVVEKRLMLKEEIRVTRQQQTTHQPQKVTLKSEEVVVEPLDSQVQPS